MTTEFTTLQAEVITLCEGRDSPIATAILAVLRESHEGCKALGRCQVPDYDENWMASHPDPDEEHPRDCHGTGYTLDRTWEQLRAKGRIGALDGVLDWLAYDPESPIDYQEWRDARLTGLIESSDPDTAALQAVIALMKEGR